MSDSEAAFDPYAILGVEREADIKAIAAAYRTAAKKFHPDVAGGDAAKFAEAAKAYEILSDPEKRARFDQDGVIEDPAVKIDKIAIETILLVFRQVIDGENSLDHAADLLGDIKSFLRDEVRLTGMEVRKLKRKIGRGEVILKRLKKKGGGESVIHGLLRAEAEAHTRKINKLDMDIAIKKRAIAIIDDHEFSPAFQSEFAGLLGSFPIVGLFRSGGVS